jgi:transposase-like protein
VSQDISIGWPVDGRRVSKARLVITAVVVEGRTQSEVAREYGVSQGWISRLVARYRLEGPAVFAPQSRRPHTSPTCLPQPTIDLIIELHEKLTAASTRGRVLLAHSIRNGHHQLPRPGGMTRLDPVG